MIVQQVPLEYVQQAWKLVEKYVADALQYAQGDYTVEQAKVYITSGSWVLYVAVDEHNQICGAASVRFDNMPNARVAFVTTIGGHLMAGQDTWDQFTELLRQRGATRVEGAVRASMAKLWERYGATEKYRILGVSL